MIKIKKQNEAYLKVECPPDIAMELSQQFTFTVPGYKFMSAYRFGGWDGKIRLFNYNKKTMYSGLMSKVCKYFDEQNYEYLIDDSFAGTQMSAVEAEEFITNQKTPFPMKDYQLKTFIKAVRQNNGLFVSPTASGKSFIIYMLSKHYKEEKKLIIVPTINLVNQMKNDFIDYDLTKKIEKQIQIIKGGETKEISSSIVISTWQSIYKMPKAWLNQFGVVIVDEAHLAAAKSLTGIMSNMEKCKFRFGFTGTLDGSKTNEMVLEGLFGPVTQVTTTRELMDRKDIAQLKIKSIILKYPEELRKSVKGGSYEDELKFLFSHQGRNKFIEKLALSLKGNTLIIYSRIDDHGIPMFESLQKQSDRPMYIVHGKVDGDEREEIRKIVNTHQDSITVASTKTFSTGINIPNINNIIFASPSKSRVSVLQSIGRGLRKSEVKTACTLFDIADDLSYKKWRNYTIRHYVERLKMYISEKLEYKQYNVGIK